MNVSSARFDLTKTEQARIKTFEDYIWKNSEVCNHCFSRVRDVEINQSAKRLSKTSLKNHPASFHERTELGSQEHHEWDYNTQFGTCFCLECGGDLTASHHQIPLEQMIEFSRNLFAYTRDHTPLQIDGNRLVRELGELKRRCDTQGKESQMFAVAFARALQTRTETSTPQNTQPAD